MGVSKCIVCDAQFVRLYRFPKDESMKKIWCENLKLSYSDLKTNARICSIHFDPVFNGRKKLKLGAIPTLLLGHNDVDLYMPVVEYNEGIALQKKIKSCCIKECQNDNRVGKMYSFPKTEGRRREWFEACVLKDHISKNKALYICGDHFEKDDLGKRKLKKSSFPKYNLVITLENEGKEFPVENITQLYSEEELKTESCMDSEEELKTESYTDSEDVTNKTLPNDNVIQEPPEEQNTRSVFSNENIQQRSQENTTNYVVPKSDRIKKRISNRDCKKCYKMAKLVKFYKNKCIVDKREYVATINSLQIANFSLYNEINMLKMQIEKANSSSGIQKFRRC